MPPVDLVLILFCIRKVELICAAFFYSFYMPELIGKIKSIIDVLLHNFTISISECSPVYGFKFF